MFFRPGIINVGYKTFQPNRAASKWYTGPWPAPYDAVPAIPLANVVAAYQPKWAVGTVWARSDAASYANSKLNLAAPGTRDATEGVAPAWASGTGWIGDGATTYLDTGIIVPTPVTYSMIASFTGIVSNAVRGDGMGNGRIDVFPNWFAGRRYRNGNISILTITGGAVASAVLAVTPSATFINGVSDGALATDNQTSAVNIRMLRSVTTYLTGNVTACAVYNVPLTAAQAAAISAAMAVIAAA